MNRFQWTGRVTGVLGGLLLLLLIGASCGAADQGRAGAVAQEESGSVAAIDPEDLVLNGLQPFDGVVTGGLLAPEQLSLAAMAGFKTIVDLRTEEEGGPGPAESEAAGLSYIRLPIAGDADLTEENARAFGELLKKAEHPLIVHCRSGNRVGALFAIKAFYVDGLSVEESLAIGRASGLTRAEGAVRARLGLVE